MSGFLFRTIGRHACRRPRHLLLQSFGIHNAFPIARFIKRPQRTATVGVYKGVLLLHSQPERSHSLRVGNLYSLPRDIGRQKRLPENRSRLPIEDERAVQDNAIAPASYLRRHFLRGRASSPGTQYKNTACRFHPLNRIRTRTDIWPLSPTNVPSISRKSRRKRFPAGELFREGFNVLSISGTTKA